MSAGRLSRAPLPSRAMGCSAALSAPSRNSRTLELDPSAPMSKSPFTAVPSSKCAVTEESLSAQEILVSLFPYWKRVWVSQAVL